MYRKSTRSWMKHLDFIILDLIVIGVSFFAAYLIRFGISNLLTDISYRNIFLAIYGFHILIAFFSHNYSDIVRRGYFTELRFVLMQNFLIMACIAFYLVFTQQGQFYSRLFWIYFFLIDCFLMLLVRDIRKWMVRRNLQSREHRDELLVITRPERAQDCLNGLMAQEYQSYHICGVALLNEEQVRLNRKEAGIKTDMAGYTRADASSGMIDDIPIVAASVRSVESYVQDHVVDQIFLDADEVTPQMEDLIQHFLDMGIVVHVGLGQFIDYMPNKQIQNMGKFDVITSSIQTVSVVELFFKRVLDIIGSIVGLLITGVVFIFVAPAIKLSSPGPIFFSQIRVGRNGRKFKLYKFRSMYVDAEERKQKMMDQNEVSGPMFKMSEDPRIVKGVGKFIRETSIDELPQFWNVLRGDMSLVGTRPPTVEEYERYEYHHKIRLSFRPGITGLWQVSGRSTITDFEEVVKLDEEYIENWSLWNDVKILLKTVVVVIQRKGSG